ncbi:MAG: glutamine--fructose-6-phosphate transaminase (isomerizing) [Coleofasciculaceae cyanobacterium SM2_1_6]|nr:glutamine--fructose-6-phosphate transaminase (isomerizing) [Coleofasciculaceae cyanobacterium SM2_1_6]
MCGIVGYIGTKRATEILMAGLEKLEYRGYDSAGIATIEAGDIQCVRAKGKLFNLRDKLVSVDSIAHLGIGHTRWATHGKPEEYNAHPHMDTALRIAVVMNGIVENYRSLREELKAKGHEFRSDTDTEVIPHLIAECLMGIARQDLGTTSKFLTAVRLAVSRLQGAFAIAIISADYPEEFIVARQQAPLVLGYGDGEFFCASDVPALVPYTRLILPLQDGEIARLSPLGIEVYNFAGDKLKRSPRTLNWNPVMVEKQGFKHYMLKEIYEQPGVVRACLAAYLSETWEVGTAGSPIDLKLPTALFKDIEQIQILACGTSWHAGLVGKHLLEQLAGIPTTVQYASEFRYSPSPITPHTLTIGVTQSGETGDTLTALDLEKNRRSQLDPSRQPRLLGITNRPESSLGRLVPNLIETHAGIEIGVAATKTFVTQLIAFYCLAIDLAYQRQTQTPAQIGELVTGLRQLPALIEVILESQERYIETLSHEFSDTQDFIFIGRGINFPIALEGSLKLKEISYIHAEGYPAGEMKHGPIALLDAKVPVVAIAVPGNVYEKVLSNAQEAKARDARLIGVTVMDDPEAALTFDDVLPIPAIPDILSPILTVIPLQLLAYHIAARRGLDVDQPRNLAKSVTVE